MITPKAPLHRDLVVAASLVSAPAGPLGASESDPQSFDTRSPARLSFDELWKPAIEKYYQETGIHLLEDSYACDLLACNAVEDVVRALSRRDKAFKAYRANREKLRAILRPVVRLLQLFTDASAEAASVCMPANLERFLLMIE
jgi:hypothetical protein